MYTFTNLHPLDSLQSSTSSQYPQRQHLFISTSINPLYSRNYYHSLATDIFPGVPPHHTHTFISTLQNSTKAVENQKEIQSATGQKKPQDRDLYSFRKLTGIKLLSRKYENPTSSNRSTQFVFPKRRIFSSEHTKHVRHLG